MSVIVELDAPPEHEKTAKDCAILNKAYVTGTLGLALCSRAASAFTKVVKA
jgi:hypothetical protein